MCLHMKWRRMLSFPSRAVCINSASQNRGVSYEGHCLFQLEFRQTVGKPFLQTQWRCLPLPPAYSVYLLFESIILTNKILCNLWVCFQTSREEWFCKGPQIKTWHIWIILDPQLFGSTSWVGCCATRPTLLVPSKWSCHEEHTCQIWKPHLLR